MKKIKCFMVFGLLFVLSITTAFAEEIGSVSTTFRALGANDKIIVQVVDDPTISGVSCYLSRAKTGGIGGMVGVAEDTADASIECLKTGKIFLTKDIRTGKLDGEQVFKQSTSILFKTIQIVRFYDKKRNVLIYMVYSDKLIDGSPKNSISVVSIN